MQSGEVRTDGYAPSEDEEAEVRATIPELSGGTFSHMHLLSQCRGSFGTATVDQLLSNSVSQAPVRDL